MDEEQIKKLLIGIPGSRRAAGGVIVGDENGSFYITDIRERDDDLAPEEGFFRPSARKKKSFG